MSTGILVGLTGLTKERLDVHAVYIPELPIDLEREAARLKDVLDKNDNVNIFICARTHPHHQLQPVVLVSTGTSKGTSPDFS